MTGVGGRARGAIAVLAAAAAAAGGAPAATMAAPGGHDRVVRDDGRVVLLHGDAPDFGVRTPRWDGSPAVRAPTGRAAGQETVVPADSWCGDVRATDDVDNARTTLRRFKVLYLHPADRANRLPDAIADRIQRTVSAVAGKYLEDGTGVGVRFDYGTSCGPAYVDITSLRTTRPASAYETDPTTRLELVRDDVLQARRDTLRLDRGRWDWLVFADLPVRTDPGTGFKRYAEAVMELADETDPDPRVNRNAAAEDHMAVLYDDAFDGTEPDGYTAYAATHEITHTLGAVMATAPHRTAGRHCTDGVDLMCYDDGTAGGASYTTTACSRDGTPTFDVTPLDCNRDDYFHPAPPLGSMLARTWNVARHPAVCPADLCLASTIEPEAAATVRDGPRVAGSAVRFDASATTDRDGNIVRYDWDVDGDGTAEQSTAAPALDIVPRRSGVVGGGTVTVVDATNLTSSAALPAVRVAGRPPVMALSAGPPALSWVPVHLDASGSADPDEGDRVVAYRFTFGDGQVVDLATPRTTWTPTRPGRHVVRVAGVDGDGLVAETTAVVDVVNRAPVLVARPPSRIAAHNETALRAQASDADGRIDRVVWDLGDGAARPGPTVRAVLGRLGMRTLRVTATDDLGATTTREFRVRVVRGPLRSVRRSRRGTLAIKVACPRRDRACRLRVDAGGRRTPVDLRRRALRTVRVTLPARLRTRTVRLVVRERRSGRRLATRPVAAPRR